MPPYSENPFAAIPFKRLKIEDAKPIFIFDAQIEVAFLRTANSWAFPIHFTLAKTGLRVGELCHLLIEEVDLAEGWLHVRNKPELGWQVKTRNERSVPLIPELIAVLRAVIGKRAAGPAFLRERFHKSSVPQIVGDRADMAKVLRSRQVTNSTEEMLKVAKCVWKEAGALNADDVRKSFIHVAAEIGLAVTCPKSWRHTFATLLQDANVDPLIRQITLGHSPAANGGLGMTANYTHTRRDTLRLQVDRAMRLWGESLSIVDEKYQRM